MQLIVAVDANWGIGYKNNLLVQIPADMRFFREVTTGNVVIMGRKTLLSFPAGQPLKNRMNIVISSDPEYKVKGATVVNSIEEAVETARRFASDEEIYVIGGATIYEQMLKYCDVAHVTKIDFAYQADTYFPNLDATGEWEVTADSDEQTYHDLEYRFYRYERKNKVIQ